MMMKFITAFTVGALSFSTTAYAVDCTPENVKAVSDNCEKEGKTGAGTDAKASCTATISAPDGYFILDNDIELNFSSTYEGIKDGSRPQGRQKISSVAYEPPADVSSNPLLVSAKMYSSFTAEAYCDRSFGSRLGKTCYARASLAAKTYPASCLKKWVSQ